MIDFDEIKRILAMMREHELVEFEFEGEGLKVRLRKESTRSLPAAPVSPASVVDASSAAPGSPPSTPDEGDASALAIVKSPVVGTFYRSPEADAPPFVQVGDTVTEGQVLCIIEAMKLMNEIDSEHGGEIVNVFVESGQPVQYGERLFAIKTG